MKGEVIGGGLLALGWWLDHSGRSLGGWQERAEVVARSNAYGVMDQEYEYESREKAIVSYEVNTRDTAQEMGLDNQGIRLAVDRYYDILEEEGFWVPE